MDMDKELFFGNRTKMGKIHSAVLKTHFYAEKSEQRTNAHRPPQKNPSLYVENRRRGQSVPAVLPNPSVGDAHSHIQ